MPLTNFPYGFAAGLTLKGMPLLQTQPGNVFWVDNGPPTTGGGSHNPLRTVGGSDNNQGTFQRPFATISYALTQCVHGSGDIIFVKPGHVEQVIAAGTATTNMLEVFDPTGLIPISTGGASNYLFNMNVAGVAIIGLGTGNLRPQLQYSTATSANVLLQAAGMSLQNFLLVGQFAAVVSAFTAQRSTFTGSIAGNVLTVASALTGSVNVGAAIATYGAGAVVGAYPPGVIILSQLTGTANGVGTYLLNYGGVTATNSVASGTITTGPVDFNLENCELRDFSSSLGFVAGVTTSATNNTCDGLRVAGCKMFSTASSGAIALVKLGANIDRIDVAQNYVTCAAGTTTASGALIVAGANVMTNAKINGNVAYKPNTAASAIALVSTSASTDTGMFYDNYGYTVTSGTGLAISASSGLGLAQNFATITGASTGPNAIINPTAA